MLPSVDPFCGHEQMTLQPPEDHMAADDIVAAARQPMEAKR